MFLQHHKEPGNPPLAAVHIPRKGWARYSWIALVGCLLLSLIPARAQAQEEALPKQEPRGAQVQFALSTMGGNGAQIGLVSARTVYTREVMVLSDLDPLWRDIDRRARVVVLPGISLRMFGFERLIGGAAYRGFDVDIGLRAGPGLTFDTDETSAERDRRFELVVEPFLRLTSAGSGRLAWLLEIGSTRPALRFGVWIAY